MRNSQDPW
jgi:hypothetical protein